MNGIGIEERGVAIFEEVGTAAKDGLADVIPSGRWCFFFFFSLIFSLSLSLSFFFFFLGSPSGPSGLCRFCNLKNIIIKLIINFSLLCFFTFFGFAGIFIPAAAADKILPVTPPPDDIVYAIIDNEKSIIKINNYT